MSNITTATAAAADCCCFCCSGPPPTPRLSILNTESDNFLYLAREAKRREAVRALENVYLVDISIITPQQQQPPQQNNGGGGGCVKNCREIIVTESGEILNNAQVLTEQFSDLTVDLLNVLRWKGQEIVLANRVIMQWVEANTRNIITVKVSLNQLLPAAADAIRAAAATAAAAVAPPPPQAAPAEEAVVNAAAAANLHHKKPRFQM